MMNYGQLMRTANAGPSRRRPPGPLQCAAPPLKALRRHPPPSRKPDQLHGSSASLQRALQRNNYSEVIQPLQERARRRFPARIQHAVVRGIHPHHRRHAKPRRRLLHSQPVHNAVHRAATNKRGHLMRRGWQRRKRQHLHGLRRRCDSALSS